LELGGGGGDNGRIAANQLLASSPPEPSGDGPVTTDSARSRRGVFVGIAVAAALLIVASVVASLVPRSSRSWQGTLVTPAGAKPEFTLTDTSGHPYDFAKQTSGQLTLLYFGYTHCPDACPITFATLAGALGNLPGTAVTVVFVTTDPARDDPARLRSWLDQYNTHFVGLTGSPAALAAAQRAAGVTVAIANRPDAAGHYTVGHAASVLAYTPDGRQHLVFPYGITEAGWQHDLGQIQSEKTWNRAP
jgi:protein SCO1